MKLQPEEYTMAIAPPFFPFFSFLLSERGIVYLVVPNFLENLFFFFSF